MFFVVPAEETCVGEVVIPCYLLDALRGVLQLHLYLQNYVLVDYRLWSVVGDLSHYKRKILRGDVH